MKELELPMERETIGLPPTEKSPVISISSKPGPSVSGDPNPTDANMAKQKGVILNIINLSLICKIVIRRQGASFFIIV